MERNLFSTLVLIIFVAVFVSVFIDGVFSATCPDMTRFDECQIEAEEDWNINRNNKEEDLENWCCFRWQAFECQLALGKSCTGFDAKYFNITMEGIQSNTDEECEEFPYGTSTCKTKLFAIKSNQNFL